MAEPRLKRPLDVLLAGIGMVVLGPVVGVISAAIKLDSPGPVMYRATRSGRGGHPFTMYKFRTMHERRETHGPRITTHADRRITRIGALLRPSRLDELPQLWNVLRGEMSLVGPRPEDPQYVELYSHENRVVLEARPGVTSLAALLYRDEERLLVGEEWERIYVQEVMPAKLAIDRAYVEHQTIWLDLKILAATALAPLRLEWLVPFDKNVAGLGSRAGISRAVSG
jgi:lipopolysaccharide/colanic/teichoic acid biosynthesis glycosyltransferase